jgi:DnaJ like chaperone protein
MVFIWFAKAAMGLAMLWERFAAGDTVKQNGRRSSVLARILDRTGLSRFFRPRRASESAAFTTAFVSLAAKMAKADGVALLAEEQAFERFLELKPADAANVRRLYALAKTNTAGFELYATRIGRLLAKEPHLKINVLECLLYVACSDGVLHPAEDVFLRTVAEKFGVADADFKRLRAMFVHDPHCPYDLLGITPDATLPEIKARYRYLVTHCHPDRLMASGAKAAIIKAATTKIAAINVAYGTIMKERAPERQREGRS